jgi:hypothetical protein
MIPAVEAGLVTPTPIGFPPPTVTDRPPVQTTTTYPPALAEQVSRAYVKPRLHSDARTSPLLASVHAPPSSGISMDPSPVSQRLASSAGSSSGDGRQYQDASPRVNTESDNLGLPVDGQGRRPVSPESRGNNGPPSSASRTTGAPMSPGAVPPAYSYRP